MAGPWPVPRARRLRYSGTPSGAPMRACCAGVALALALGAASAGCSCQLPARTRCSGKDDAKPADATGSIRAARRRRRPAACRPTADLAYAKAAAAEVLAPRRQGRQPALGKSRAPARAAPSRRSPTAYTQDGFDLPRLPGELRPRRRRSPGCRARPAACRQGNWEVRNAAALEAVLSSAARTALRCGERDSPHIIAD